MPTGVDRGLQLFDSSAAVPLVVHDHEFHGTVLEVADRSRRGLAGHAWFETYSVLTRMPAGARRSPQAVFAALHATFPETRFLDPDAAMTLRAELAQRGIAGGAVFDALVAAVARELEVPLVTCDKRAKATYEALGVRVIWPQGVDR
jgi:predicted nucleic acid-binding protein